MTKTASEVSIDAKQLKSMKEDFDNTIQSILDTMYEKNATEASVTLKLTISLEKTTAYTNKGATDVIRPIFTHKVNSVMTVKDSKVGEMIDEVQLVRDTDTGKFYLTPVSSDGQMSFDSDGNVFGVDMEEVEEEEPTDSTIYNPVWEQNQITEYGWLMRFIGKKITVSESLGHYTARTDDGKMVYSSMVSSAQPSYCSKDVLAPFAGKELICNSYSNESLENGKVEKSIAIETVDGSEIMTEVYE